jgi:hypothetical protein
MISVAQTALFRRIPGFISAIFIFLLLGSAHFGLFMSSFYCVITDKPNQASMPEFQEGAIYRIFPIK